MNDKLIRDRIESNPKYKELVSKISLGIKLGIFCTCNFLAIF